MPTYSATLNLSPAPIPVLPGVDQEFIGVTNPSRSTVYVGTSLGVIVHIFAGSASSEVRRSFSGPLFAWSDAPTDVPVTIRMFDSLMADNNGSPLALTAGGGVTNLGRFSKVVGAIGYSNFAPRFPEDIACWLSPRAAYSDVAQTTLVATDGNEVLGLRDLSGRGNSGSASAGTGLTYRTGANGINGYPALAAGSGRKILVPNFWSGQTSFTVYVVCTYPSGTGLKVALSSPSTTNMASDGLYLGGGDTGHPDQSVTTCAGSKTYFAWQNVGVLSVSWNGTVKRVGFNSLVLSESLVSFPIPSGALAVGDLVGGGFSWTGLISDILIYSKAHSVDQIHQVVSDLLRSHGISNNLVIDGNSISRGYGLQLQATSYSAQLISLLGSSWAAPVNIAVASRTQIMQNLDAQTTVANTFNPYMDRNIIVTHEGTNDIFYNSGTNAVPYVETAVQNLAGYCLSRKAEGWDVGVCSILPRYQSGIQSDFELARQKYNASVRSNWQSYADFYAAVGEDPKLGSVGAMGGYYLDSIHPNVVGASIMAMHVANGIAHS